ncbi:DUF2716 domain-containing protein [Catenulispora yoronensis]|uniref:DUF2716 domain-containing protein n=1 Tax=Catenulispora yoronensis TaxID=450799 RepID=A0ABN2VCN4_9ACTN
MFAHDRAASQLAEALDGAGFTAGWERSVLVGEAAELDLPQPAAECKVASFRWEEAEARQALELSARSGPHRVPLEAWHTMRSTPNWDVDIRVLIHRGRAIAACWLENVRDTAFVTVGGLTAPRSELLAELPLWRLRKPTKKFLVVDADGDLRDALLAASFCEVTTVQSYHWAPPGEPAAAPPARQSLNDAEYLHIARRCEARIGFDYASGSGRYSVPIDSRTWFYGMFGGSGDPVIAAAERVIELGLRACVPPGEWVYEYRPYLNGWEFDPHRVGNPGQPRWPGNALADREFQFLTTADARLGTFGQYAEQTLVVFGNDLIEQVGEELDRLLGGGAWTFD